MQHNTAKSTNACVVLCHTLIYFIKPRLSEMVHFEIWITCYDCTEVVTSDIIILGTIKHKVCFVFTKVSLHIKHSRNFGGNTSPFLL